MSLAPTPEARDRLRARLGLDPTSAKPFESLTAAQEEHLAAIIARSSGASTRAIARRFIAESGRKVALETVRARRPGRRADCPQRPLTAAESSLLLDLIRSADPDATRAEVAKRFEVRAGRPVSVQTVANYAIKRLGQPSRGRRFASADEWPTWTDSTSFGLPWREDDRITLGPAAAKGGAR